MSDATSAAGYSAQRVHYALGALDVADLAATPLAQFERWYADAVAASVAEPNAMVVATVDGGGAPSARTVLLKQADARGFVFYTNYGSRKARELDGSGAVALTFPWYALQRQVSVLGRAERVGRAETAAYFGSRPWASRIGAWVSRQSEPVADRAGLEARWAVLADRWPDHGGVDDVPVPEHWGGYLVRAHEVEFWQGRPSRLHDRLVYATAGARSAALDDGTAWSTVRRQP